MQFYPHRTVEEQANRLPEELREAYTKSQIDRITISNGTEELELTGYAEYSYLEERSYTVQPVRSNDGQIVDIDEYATFLTPRLIIKYNMMGIEDYRALMKMLRSKNSFIVTLYDVVEDKRVRKEMYVAPNPMPIIYQQFLIAMGIQEYSIELIGTNVPVGELISFTLGGKEYQAEPGSTFEDWINSPYNTDGYGIASAKDGLFKTNTGSLFYIKWYFHKITPENIIVDSRNYDISY